MNFIPQASSTAGLSLTMANWSEAGINALAFSLESLLLKPGLSLLKSIENIRQYLAWSGCFILNAGQIQLDSAGNCRVISPFDGSKLDLSCEMLIDIILHLKPDVVILPKNTLSHYPKIWNNWNDSIMPYLHGEDLDDSINLRHGLYFNLDNSNDAQFLSDYLKRPIQLPYYVSGKIDLDFIKNQNGLHYFESDEPAKEAVAGRVYTSLGMLDLFDRRYEQDFKPLNAACKCLSCSKGLSKAYLHHLLQHTPLLCQRYLVLHNIVHLKTQSVC